MVVGRVRVEVASKISRPDTLQDGSGEISLAPAGTARDIDARWDIEGRGLRDRRQATHRQRRPWSAVGVGRLLQGCECGSSNGALPVRRRDPQCRLFAWGAAGTGSKRSPGPLRLSLDRIGRRLYRRLAFDAAA